MTETISEQLDLLHIRVSEAVGAAILTMIDAIKEKQVTGLQLVSETLADALSEFIDPSRICRVSDKDGFYKENALMFAALVDLTEHSIELANKFAYNLGKEYKSDNFDFMKFVENLDGVTDFYKQILIDNLYPDAETFENIILLIDRTVGYLCQNLIITSIRLATYKKYIRKLMFGVDSFQPTLPIHKLLQNPHLKIYDYTFGDQIPRPHKLVEFSSDQALTRGNFLLLTNPKKQYTRIYFTKPHVHTPDDSDYESIIMLRSNYFKNLHDMYDATVDGIYAQDISTDTDGSSWDYDEFDQCSYTTTDEELSTDLSDYSD